MSHSLTTRQKGFIGSDLCKVVDKLKICFQGELRKTTRKHHRPPEIGFVMLSFIDYFVCLSNLYKIRLFCCSNSIIILWSIRFNSRVSNLIGDIDLAMGFILTTLIFIAVGIIACFCTRVCCNKGPSANLYASILLHLVPDLVNDLLFLYLDNIYLWLLLIMIAALIEIWLIRDWCLLIEIIDVFFSLKRLIELLGISRNPCF